MRPKHLLLAAIPSLAACGTDVAGPSASLFSCLLTPTVGLEVGEAVQASGAGNRGLCLEAGTAAAELVYIPFHAAGRDNDSPPRIPLEISGAGLTSVTGPPTPSPLRAEAPVAVSVRGGRATSPVRPDPVFHRRLRERERRELTLLLKTPGAAALAPRPSAIDVPEVGELVSYNVAISCTESDFRTGRVEHVSERAVVVADVENPVGLTAIDFQHFGETFDTLVDPVAVRHFGEPTDIDENGRAIIFFTRAVNELPAPAEGVVTVGFFWSGDLFPEEDTPRAEACPAANQAEIFYMRTADPLGQVGPEYTVEDVRRLAIPIIAHEYQHLINASRRLWINEAREFEVVWLNEGLSHTAEELVFYAASGMAPGQNIGYDELTAVAGAREVFNTFMGGNFTNYSRYLLKPDTASLMGIDALPTRGASWSFLRYAADRSGRPDDAFFHDLVNARDAGLDNLRNALGADPLAWMRDWTVSVYADDVVPTDPRFQQASWDFRDLYPNSTLGAFPLQVLLLGASGEVTVRLQPGGAAFARFGLEADGRGVLHLEVGGAAPPDALRGTFLRTR